MSVIQGIIAIRLQSIRSTKRKNGTPSKRKSSKFFRILLTILNNKEETLQARSIWCLLLCLGFSVVGLTIDFFWFAFCMAYLIIFSPQILEVTNAVWKPKKRILSTLILSGIIMYWFGIVGYVYFSSDFNGVIEGSNTTLRRCLAVIFDSWYKYGLGSFLADNGRSAIMIEGSNGNKSYKVKGARMSFDFIFFFIVPTLLLSILSGIIIDNFGERRAKSDSIKLRQNDQCFVCGKMSSDLTDFEGHCKFKHNIWDYMYYIGYLRSMEASERKDFKDIHVFDCIQKQMSNWFPAYRDFVLQEANNQGEISPSLVLKESHYGVNEEVQIELKEGIHKVSQKVVGLESVVKQVLEKIDNDAK